MPVEADGVANALRDRLHAGAVEVDAAHGGVAFRRQAVVTGLPDLEVELVVGADGDVFPAVRLILRQTVEDDGRLRRIVEIVLDLVDLRELGQLHDVERAVLEGDAVRAVEPRGDDLHLALAALVDDGIDLVLQPRAHEHGALVAERERAGVGHAAGIDLDLESLRSLELVDRQLVGGGRERRGRDRREPLGVGGVGTPDQGRAGRQRRGLLRGRRLLGGRRPRSPEQCADSSGEHEALP